MQEDISPILDNWEYKPEQVTVRKIRGVDGRVKIQMRLELGLLQMELTGRPDGKRPYGKESLLEYYTDLLQEHIEFFGSDEGFELDSEACAALRQESLGYYYRYLALFHLNEYGSVVQDTARNLRVFDLVWKYAADESDKWMLEQYRPYVTMMNTRARALLSIGEGDFDRALHQISEGITRIEKFFAENEHEDLMDSCSELQFLREWREQIRQQKPLTPREKLSLALAQAVEREDYESAAKLRDAIRSL